MKYGGTPPHIKVGCELSGQGMVKYWVKDNGDGIPEDQHTKIFRKHTRLQPDKAGGYGLGLSIVKRIIEKLGGKVGVESTGEKGAGSLFYFKLPAVRVEALTEVR
jgi:signal transduction histidine kinase